MFINKRVLERRVKMELLDVLDEEGNETGRVEEKDVIHEKALWHKEVDVWIVNEQGKILIQKRAATKKQAPNKWSSTGGHVKSGEDVKEAMVREIKEEIGMDCKKENLHLILIAKHRSWRGDNNVFRYLYFYRTEKQLQDFIIEKREVSELKYISIQELEHIVENKDENYLFWREEYIQDVIHYLKKNI